MSLTKIAMVLKQNHVENHMNWDQDQTWFSQLTQTVSYVINSQETNQISCLSALQALSLNQTDTDTIYSVYVETNHLRCQLHNIQ